MSQTYIHSCNVNAHVLHKTTQFKLKHPSVPTGTAAQTPTHPSQQETALDGSVSHIKKNHTGSTPPKKGSNYFFSLSLSLTLSENILYLLKPLTHPHLSTKSFSLFLYHTSSHHLIIQLHLIVWKMNQGM